MLEIDKAIELIKKSDVIVLSSHTNPDGDAIGSTYGLFLALKKFGKNPIIVIEEYSQRFNKVMNPFNIYKEDINSLEIDLFISLDCGDIDRLLDEHILLFKKAKNSINIDHHASNDDFGDVNIVDTEKSSTCEVVYELINKLVDIDKDIMSAVYTGIITDSGGFKYSKVSSNTHNIAGLAHDLGVDFNGIYCDVLDSHTITEMKIFSKALENIRYDVDNEIIYTTITLKEMEQCNADKDDLGKIVSYLLNTDGFNLSIFIYEKEDENKVSFRSKKLDVNLLANAFGGGGHQLASGCSIQGDIEEVMSIVLEKAKEYIADEKFI